MATAKASTKVVRDSVKIVPVPPKPVVPTPEARETQTAAVEILMQRDKLAELREQKRALDEQMKTLRERNKANRLNREINRQLQHPNKALVYTLGAALRNRVAVGQDRTVAIDEILEQCRTLLETAEARQPRKATTTDN